MKKILLEEITTSLRQAGKLRKGEKKTGRFFKYNPKSEVARIRRKLGLSQSRFAALLGVTKEAVQNWEQGRRDPAGAAKVLLRVAAKYPKVLLDVV